MKVAVVGGGINGLCVAWQLAENGHQVSLFEKGELLSQTSSSSSKLLHGGLRYLENLEFRLVKEALHERGWWLANVSEYTNALKIFLPIYEDSRRSWWKIKSGLMLYDYLAGKSNIGSHSALGRDQFGIHCSELKQEGLTHVYTFFDGQMDEAQLGLWVAEQARKSGVDISSNSEVQSVSEDGCVRLVDQQLFFDQVVNVAGPWACELLRRSGLGVKHSLDLVRGSHLLLNREVSSAYMLEVPGERRVFFVLPYQGKTLVGTTEVRQKLDEDILCSKDEIDYLVSAYNHYFVQKISAEDIAETFAGVRPLIKSAADPSKTTREYAIERSKRVVSVFGGKWTTARALAREVVKEVGNGIH